MSDRPPLCSAVGCVHLAAWVVAYGTAEYELVCPKHKRGRTVLGPVGDRSERAE